MNNICRLVRSHIPVLMNSPLTQEIESKIRDIQILHVWLKN